MIRTRKIPFIQSRASLPVLLSTGAACVFALVFPFTSWGHSLRVGFLLPWNYFPWLVLTLAAYCVVTQVAQECSSVDSRPGSRSSPWKSTSSLCG